MDHPSIIGEKSAPVAANMSAAAAHPAPASVSAAIADVNAHLSPLSESSSPAPSHDARDDASHSLAEMAHRDLDAALQLLAERAQYITDASGAAIALRRGEHNDMLCRASAGSSAPDLGALISMEYGLSGESVRTRQTQRCDDAEHDPRVNREGCRQLGIASVVVMPILSDDQVLGVFQLFSGDPHAFADRDISALRRLSEIVETAVKHAVAAQIVPQASPQLAVQLEEDSAQKFPPQSSGASRVAEQPPEKEVPVASVVPAEPVQKIAEPEKPQVTKPSSEASSGSSKKKPLFWSAAVQAQSAAAAAETSANSTAVPAGLRNLQKCQSCGFPVSQGRTFCVECEEKQWRGERASVPSEEVKSAVVPAVAAVSDAPPVSTVPPKATASPNQKAIVSTTVTPTEIAPPVADKTTPSFAPTVPDDAPPQVAATLFSASAAPSESWLSANKYVLAVLLVVALIIATLAWMR